MSSIQSITHHQTNLTSSQASATTQTELDATKNQIPEEAVAYDNPEQITEAKPYKVDMAKIKEMKAENDQHLIEVMLKTSAKGLIKQLGGLRGVIEKLIKGETVDESFEVTPESIKKAQEDVAPGGYWSPEKTSDRFLEFAKALAGEDPAKANMLLDAFKEGYAQAEKLWGGKLPEISQQTYDLTLSKFEEWSKSSTEN